MSLKLSISGAIAVALLLLTGCKGRTMENMEPTGDTVEVHIVPNAESAPEQSIN